MYKTSTFMSSIATPNVEKNEGLRPERYAVPSYLPLVRFDKRQEDYKVLSHGKPVAVDSNNFLVPAGLALDVEQAIADGDFTNTVNKYSTVDVAEGVRNFAGNLVTDGEPVVQSFFTNGDATLAQLNFIGTPVGIAANDAWRSNGAGYGDGYGAGNPMDYTYQNYNLQNGLTVVTRSYIELPVISNISELLLPGIVAFEGTPAISDLVTFNANSNFVTLSKLAGSTFAAATAGNPTDAELIAEFDRLGTYMNKTFGRILGKVYFIDNKWPKDYMDKVRTWNPNPGTPLTEVAPGSATKGLPDTLVYAGQTDPATAKTVKINLIAR